MPPLGELGHNNGMCKVSSSNTNNNEFTRLGKLKSLEKKINSILILNKLQTFIIFVFCKQPVIEHTVIFAMHVHVSIVS